MELAERVDRLLVALVSCVRCCTFELSDECEPRGAEDRAAECHRTMAGVAVAASEAPLQPGPEEDEHERDQGCEEETGELMLSTVVLSPRERPLERGLTVRNAPCQGEPAREQESSEHSCERKEACESV